MTKQEELKYLIHTLGIKHSMIAEKLDMKVQTLSYLINESPQFDDDLYKQIKKILEKIEISKAIKIIEKEESKININNLLESSLENLKKVL